MAANNAINYKQADRGAATASGLTMATAKLLGRSTASTGAIEEITLGTNLSYDGTTLNAAGGSGRLFDRVELKGPLVSGLITYQVACATGTLAGVKITVTDLPTGSSVKVDLRKNGTATTNSIFTSDTEAEITTSTGATNGVYTVTKTAIDNGSFVADDVCWWAITLIGSTLPGTNLSIVAY